MEVIKSTCTGSHEQLRLPATVRRGNLERCSGNNECVGNYAKETIVTSYAEETLVTIHSIRCVYVHMSNLAVYTNRSARVNPALPFYHTQHFTHLVQPVTLHTRHNTKEPEHLLQREAVHVETALQVSRTLRTTSLDAHADD